MAGYRATQIRKPENETEFEKNCVVLFRGILNDPNINRLGRRGQAQYGVDLVGRRDRDPKQIVGVQCKLKSGAGKLSEEEVLTEVNKALKYEPLLTEYIIVTTAGNDTKLQQYAQKLTQDQEARGRRIHIDVWGWGILSEAINNDEAAKLAFDPGFSPSLAAQTKAIKALTEGQGKLATEARVAELAANVARLGSTESVKLPPHFADRELASRLLRTLRRRGFAFADIAQELAGLAERALDSDLSLASSAVRFETLDRAARANANPKTVAAAERYLDGARNVNPSGDLTIAQALLTEAKGNTTGAIQALRSRPDPEARLAMFNILLRTRGFDAALTWVRSESLNVTDFNAAGALNLVITETQAKEFDVALAHTNSVPASYLSQCPVLHLVRAQLGLASILPIDQKAALFHGVPIDPSMLQFASGAKSQDIIRAALADIQTLLGLLPELQLGELEKFLLEFELWLQLELHDTREAARERVAKEIADPDRTLRRVRLALGYGVPFNQDALNRHLTAHKELGGWTPEERFAAFLLAYHSRDLAKLAGFFEKNHDELFSQRDLPPSALAGMEIEALARSDRIEQARAHLALHTGPHLNAEQARDINELLIGIESGDEIEGLRRRYSVSGELTDLRLLIVTLRAKRDHIQLATYAPSLARATRTVGDFELAMQTLYQSRQYKELISLSDEFPDIYALNDEFASLKGWSLLHLGRVREARTIGRELWKRRGGALDRELAINTAVETGDWGYLQLIVTHEAERTDDLPVPELMRLARLALEVNSAYVDRFRDAALKKEPDDAQTNLSAYILAVERGDEYQGSQAQAWFQKAVNRSGENGPVQKVSTKELVAQAQGWNRHVEHIDKLLRGSQLPLFVAAKALRRQLVDLTLGQALRNVRHQDARAHFPVFAFSGKRSPLDTAGFRSPALDLTTIIVLDYLGLLDTVLKHFERPVIAPGTLATLFIERQFLRIQQPSQRAKAQRIQALIASGQLRILPQPQNIRNELGRDVGRDLADLLATAQREGGLVVRSAPIYKVGSFLEETVDLAAFSSTLTDSLAVLSFLSRFGKIERATADAAKAYLHQVDKSWPNAPAVDANSKLYLDDLSVTYLDYVGILEPLTRNVAAVFVPHEVGEHVKGMLSYADFTNDVLAAIERMRAIISAALDGGHVHYSARRLSDKQDEDENVHPTLDLLFDLSQIDLAVSDDRCLNKEPFWADAASKRVPAGSTLDVLLGLKQAGRLDAPGFWGARHKLRMAGFYAVPLDVDELKHHLERATIAGGALLETPELRAIRESMVLPKLADAFMPGEDHWLATLRHTIIRTIRDLWVNEPDVAVAEAKADWLISVLPDPMAWCVDPENEASWTTARQQAAYQTGLLMIFVCSEKSRRERYFEWLEQRVLAPLQTNQPELWDSALEFVKSYIPRLMEIEYDEEA
jgi:hypothetical protein